MNLESLLGRDVLKTADFKLNVDGSVSSGKPLTQRRIQVIVNKALTTSRGEYDIGVYKAKLGAIRADIAALPARRAYDKAGATAHFEAVEKLMTFVDKEIDGLIDDYYAYDKTAPQSETNYPYVMVSKLDGQYEEKPLTSLSMVTDYVSKAMALTDKGVKFESWKDVAAEVKKNLVGTIRPIDVPVAKGNSWKFESLLDEKGKPVVRAITWT